MKKCPKNVEFELKYNFTINQHISSNMICYVYSNVISSYRDIGNRLHKLVYT